MKVQKEVLDKHLKSHSKRSDEDMAAVSVLETFLRSGGKINCDFKSNDKWPNTDGNFELVINPNNSRLPTQNFSVQIKGTALYESDEDKIRYRLQSLAFPAYIYENVTSDPGILFVVLNPTHRGSERVFWKYMSVDFLVSIDYNKSSAELTFEACDEICDTDESVDAFCKELEKVVAHHKFVGKLAGREYTLKEVENIIKRCNQDIIESIDRFDIYNDTRDNVSQRILNRLYDLCISALLYNSLSKGNSSVSLAYAWEQSLLDIHTKYLGSFLQMIKYIDSRVPEEGQSERLMLKYYSFLWQIREDFKANSIHILNNLEKFPLKTDPIDEEYFSSVAEAIEKQKVQTSGLRPARYYVQNKMPFYIGKNRYFEVTLQLAGKYATKFNRVTVYTKENISSNYSIQIGYEELTIKLWDIPVKIKVVCNWRVSIDPACLNTLAKILNLKLNLSSVYGEYDELMNFLTKTGLNFLDFIDLKELDFEKIVDYVYSKANTNYFKAVLNKLHLEFGKSSAIAGKNTVRYLLLRMREDLLDAVSFKKGKKLESEAVNLVSKCYPFERNPYLSNFTGSKTSNYTVSKDVFKAFGYENVDIYRPYLKIQQLIGKTGEIYFEDALIENFDEVKKFNKSLDGWEREQGYRIKHENNIVFIESYENKTLKILRSLTNLAKAGNKGQYAFNKNFIKRSGKVFEDETKKRALEKIFVNSKVLLIYGAAGTGKTTLIKLISDLMINSKKLFMTKTHTALQNLRGSFNDSEPESKFIILDSFIQRSNMSEYDVIFVDECGVIDNYTMSRFFDKIGENTLLVLAGDIYQLESIDFGNWFQYANKILKDDAKVELLNTWRTEENSLKDLWNEVRTRGKYIHEKLALDGPFSQRIGPNIFDNYDDDEVVLCLNYDGKFGLNNINKYFQAKNNNEEHKWQEWSYKKGDPILFNESKRFTIFYNNLKGKLIDIEQDELSITFTVDIERVLTESNCNGEVEYIKNSDAGTRVRFSVYKDDGGTTDEERERSKLLSIVPFQLAYAVSIHKAQGLEYNSVKIIIPESNTEKITHGIFYTAITRAKKYLKIYWSPETMDKVISEFVDEGTGELSLEIIKNKLKR